MTPFNMKCNTCGDYISKAKKFNARKETIESETYLGLKIFRFYIKCPQCMSEITFKTNPETNDYEMEFGAHRCFDALRLAMLQEDNEVEREKEEEKLNPMKLLENRTKQSKEEMEELEKLTRLKEENAKMQGIDVDELIENRIAQEKKDEKQLLEERLKAEEAEDERTAKELMQLAQSRQVEEDASRTDSKLISSNFFAKNAKPTSSLSSEPGNESGLKKRKLEGLVAIKKKEPVKIENGLKAEAGPKTGLQTEAGPIEKSADQNDAKKPRLASLMGGYSSSEEDSS